MALSFSKIFYYPLRCLSQATIWTKMYYLSRKVELSVWIKPHSSNLTNLESYTSSSRQSSQICCREEQKGENKGDCKAFCVTRKCKKRKAIAKCFGYTQVQQWWNKNAFEIPFLFTLDMEIWVICFTPFNLPVFVFNFVSSIMFSVDNAKNV